MSLYYKFVTFLIKRKSCKLCQVYSSRSRQFLHANARSGILIISPLVYNFNSKE